MPFLRTCLIILSVSISGILAGCSMLPEWLGEKEATPHLAGKRIAVFNTEQQLVADASLAHHKVKLPPPVEYNENHASHGSQNIAPHILFAGDPIWETTFSVSEESPEEFSLTALPLVTQDKIIILDSEGNVSALSRNNPKILLWKVAVRSLKSQKKKQIYGGGMALSQGKLFVTVGNQTVTALSVDEGTILWQKQLTGVFRTVPLVDNHRLWLQSATNAIFALASDTGEILWMHAGAMETIGVLGSAAPVKEGNILLAPYSTGELYALRAEDGQEGWSVNLAYRMASTASINFTDIDALPVIKDHVIYAASHGGPLMAIHAESGHRLWENPISQIRRFWIAGDMIYMVTLANEVVAVHRETGKIKWIQNLPLYEDEIKQKNRQTIAGPVLAGGKLWITGSAGKMWLLNPESGEILHNIAIPMHVSLPVVVTTKEAYLLSDQGELAIFKPSAAIATKKAKKEGISERWNHSAVKLWGGMKQIYKNPFKH